MLPQVSTAGSLEQTGTRHVGCPAQPAPPQSSQQMVLSGQRTSPVHESPTAGSIHCWPAMQPRSGSKMPFGPQSQADATQANAQGTPHTVGQHEASKVPPVEVQSSSSVMAVGVGYFVPLLTRFVVVLMAACECLSRSGAPVHAARGRPPGAAPRARFDRLECSRPRRLAFTNAGSGLALSPAIPGLVERLHALGAGGSRKVVPERERVDLDVLPGPVPLDQPAAVRGLPQHDGTNLGDQRRLIRGGGESGDLQAVP